VVVVTPFVEDPVVYNANILSRSNSRLSNYSSLQERE